MSDFQSVQMASPEQAKDLAAEYANKPIGRGPAAPAGPQAFHNPGAQRVVGGGQVERLNPQAPTRDTGGAGFSSSGYIHADRSKVDLVVGGVSVRNEAAQALVANGTISQADYDRAVYEAMRPYNGDAAPRPQTPPAADAAKREVDEPNEPEQQGDDSGRDYGRYEPEEADVAMKHDALMDNIEANNSPEEVAKAAETWVETGEVDLPPDAVETLTAGFTLAFTKNVLQPFGLTMDEWLDHLHEEDNGAVRACLLKGHWEPLQDQARAIVALKGKR